MTSRFSDGIVAGAKYEVRTLRSPSGSIAVVDTSPVLDGIGWARLAVVRLDVTVQTLADVDDEVDWYLQTSYNEGTDWADVENYHIANAQNGGTSLRLMVISPPQSSAVARVETQGALADNTKLDLPLGDRLRLRTVLTGATPPTYAYNAEVYLYS